MKRKVDRTKRMLVRQARRKKEIRNLVLSGYSRQDAASTIGVGYDLAVSWTRDLPGPVRTGETAIAGEDDFEPIPAVEPTKTLIGSRERIACYRERVSRGESIFHPWDTTEVIPCASA